MIKTEERQLKIVENWRTNIDSSKHTRKIKIQLFQTSRVQ